MMFPVTNSSDEVIRIPFSKWKLYAMLTLGVLFVAAGIFFVMNPFTFLYDDLHLRSAGGVILLGYISIVFFGICTAMVAHKLFDRRPGLIIDKNGVTDNSSDIAVGFIPWDDVVKLSVSIVRNQRFIVVQVTYPEIYIQRQENFIKKTTLSGNHTQYGSPVTIHANTLACNFDELFVLIKANWRKYKPNSAVAYQ